MSNEIFTVHFWGTNSIILMTPSDDGPYMTGYCLFRIGGDHILQWVMLLLEIIYVLVSLL